MVHIDDLAAEFLAQQRIAVAGISRTGKDAGFFIYEKLKSTGHTLFAVNPHATEINGTPCFPNLQSIPGGLDGVVAVTSPEVTEQIVRQCIEPGVSRIWMHRSIGNSVSEKAVALCHEKGITVIPGGCPMMYQHPVDKNTKVSGYVPMKAVQVLLKKQIPLAPFTKGEDWARGSRGT